MSHSDLKIILSYRRADERGMAGRIYDWLTRHIERLEAQLEEALKRAGDRDDVAKERDVLIAQIESLSDSRKMQVDALRAALAAAEQDRDRWHDMATAKPEPVGPVERRSWWRRLAG